jgi:hypothetical protein
VRTPHKVFATKEMAATTSSKTLLTSVAFGSCNKQDKEQPLWQQITEKIRPQLWLWAGDAAYTPVPGTVAQVLCRCEHAVALLLALNIHADSLAQVR